MPAPIVFLDIAGPNRAALETFYSTLFDWNAAEADFQVPIIPGLALSIREDPAEKRFYIGVDDVAAVRRR